MLQERSRPRSGLAASARPGAFPGPADRTNGRNGGAPAFHAAVTLAVLAVGGCAGDGSEREALAEEYARRESRQIDEQSFSHARDRSRLLGEMGESVETAVPLAIDPTRSDGWQFGTMAHPVDGRLVCAALSGGATGIGPDILTVRLAVFADGAWLFGNRALAADRLESAVRIDSGLPMPLDATTAPETQASRSSATVTDEVEDAAGREDAIDVLATLRVNRPTLFRRLRRGALATISVMDEASSRSVERVIPLDGLAPMLDELERCEGAG